jgi:hypothetical protein
MISPQIVTPNALDVLSELPGITRKCVSLGLGKGTSLF